MKKPGRKTYYEIIGVSPTAKKQDIKRAFHQSALHLHPDKNPGGEEKFKELQHAYEVLSDTFKRKEYDMMLNPRPAPPSSFSFGGVSGFGFKEKAEVLKNRANAEYTAGRFPASLELYTQAIRLDSINSVLFNNRAACYLKLSRFGEALADAQRACSLRPDWAKAHGRRGAAFEGLGRHRDAMLAYSRAMSLPAGPGETDVYTASHARLAVIVDAENAASEQAAQRDARQELERMRREADERVERETAEMEKAAARRRADAAAAAEARRAAARTRDTRFTSARARVPSPLRPTAPVETPVASVHAHNVERLADEQARLTDRIARLKQEMEDRQAENRRQAAMGADELVRQRAAEEERLKEWHARLGGDATSADAHAPAAAPSGSGGTPAKESSTADTGPSWTERQMEKLRAEQVEARERTARIEEEWKEMEAQEKRVEALLAALASGAATPAVAPIETLDDHAPPPPPTAAPATAGMSRRGVSSSTGTSPHNSSSRSTSPRPQSGSPGSAGTSRGGGGVARRPLSSQAGARPAAVAPARHDVNGGGGCMLPHAYAGGGAAPPALSAAGDCGEEGDDGAAAGDPGAAPLRGGEFHRSLERC